MPKENISPTRSNLRQIKKNLEFAEEGFGLLEQKREILIMEILKNLTKIKIIEQEFKTRIEEFYDAYRKAASLTGVDSIEIKTSCERKSYSTEIHEHEIMGIKMPEIILECGRMEPIKNLMITHPSYDRAKKLCNELLEETAKYSSILKSVFMLSRELKKVQRRVNALEKIFIPVYRSNSKFITERLEEMEREELFIKKMIYESDQ